MYAHVCFGLFRKPILRRDLYKMLYENHARYVPAPTTRPFPLYADAMPLSFPSFRIKAPQTS